MRTPITRSGIEELHPPFWGGFFCVCSVGFSKNPKTNPGDSRRNPAILNSTTGVESLDRG
jgi:hypothetical protein